MAYKALSPVRAQLFETSSQTSSRIMNMVLGFGFRVWGGQDLEAWGFRVLKGGSGLGGLS